MKLPPICAACWLLGGFLAQAGSAGTPQTVELNGIAVFGGLQCAVLVLDQPMTTVGRSFVLTEGETQHGIRLLGVDAFTRSVQIENNGQKQTLRLHSAPDMAANAAATEAAIAAASAPEHDGQKAADREAVNTALIPGNPGWGTLPPNVPIVRAPATGSSPVSSGSPITFSSPSGTTVFGNADPSSIPMGNFAPTVANSTGGNSANQPVDDWYRESVSIENERIATEQQVLDGEMTPLPRTPLTPAGTPANLVDNPNGVYANHNPDFLTQNWSQM